MRRGLPLGAALILAFAAYAFHAVRLPAVAVACSCAPPPRMAELPPEAVVFTGTVGPTMVDRIPITVDAWYHGPEASEVVWVWSPEIPDGRGGITVDTCGRSLAPGAHYFLVVYGTPPEPFSTSNCSPGALVASPEGQALITEATLAFGVPRAPPAAAPSPGPESQLPAPIDLAPWLGATGLAWVAIASAAALTLLSLIVLIARRRPSAR